MSTPKMDYCTSRQRAAVGNSSENCRFEAPRIKNIAKPSLKISNQARDFFVLLKILRNLFACRFDKLDKTEKKSGCASEREFEK